MNALLDGTLEGLALRLKVPHCPEFESDLRRRLFAAELRRRVEALSAATTAAQFAERGRARRLLGDPGCLEDLRAAVGKNPRLARAQAWLGEAALAAAGGEREGREALRSAVDLGDPWGMVYRGAELIARGRGAAAAQDLQEAGKRLRREALPAFLLGVARLRMGARAEARAAFARALRLEPSCSSAALLMARASRGVSAAKAAEAALDAEPDHAHLALFEWTPPSSFSAWLTSHAEFCFAEGRDLPLCHRVGLDDTRFSPYPEEAVARARAAIAARGRRAWTLAVLGRALFRVPRASPEARREGRRALDAAIALQSRAGWTWAWRALARLGGDPRGALSDLDKCLALSPHYFRAYGWRGGLLRRMGRLKEALRDLDRAAAADERYPFSAHERSLARRQSGDWVGAALDLDRAYSLDGRYSWVYEPGREPSSDDRERGLRELARAVAANPACVSLRTWRGELLGAAGRPGEAVLALEEATALDPAHALAAGFAGLAQLEAGRPAAAAERLRRAVSLDGRHLAFRSGLAEALRRCGRAAAAEAALDEALAGRPKAWTLRLQRARWRLDDGRPSEALLEAKAARSTEGRDAEAYFVEARALAALGRWAQAEAAVGRALSISPALGRAYLLRAEARRRLGREREALADFRTAHERFPFLFNEEERARVAALLATA